MQEELCQWVQSQTKIIQYGQFQMAFYQKSFQIIQQLWHSGKSTQDNQDHLQIHLEEVQVIS